MESKQAVEVVKQAINIAVGSGAFKNTADVATIHQALGVVEGVIPVDDKKAIGPKKV